MMKKYTSIVLMAVLLCSTAGASAEENKTIKKMEDRAVIEHDFNLSLMETGWKVTASWDAFEEDGFEWFKLVYSTTNSNPVYPTDKTAFIGKQDQLQTTFKLNSWAEQHYIRLCAVVLNDDYSKDRYCGEAQTLTASVAVDDTKKEYNKQEVLKKDVNKTKEQEKKNAVNTALKKEYEKNAAKVETKVEKKTQKIVISKKLEERIDTFLEAFIERLEARDYTDEKMVETIDIVIGRLAQYEWNVRYDALVTYMKKTLNEYRLEYDAGLGELESIFSDI